MAEEPSAAAVSVQSATRRRLRCAECIRRSLKGTDFGSFADLENHINSAHEDGGRFECQICPFASPDASEAYHHLASTHSNAPPGQMHLRIPTKEAICFPENMLLSSLALACDKFSCESWQLQTKRDAGRQPLPVRSKRAKHRKKRSTAQMKLMEENRCQICQTVVWKHDEHIYGKHIGRFPFECSECEFKTTEADKAGKHRHSHLLAVLDLRQALSQSCLLVRFHAACWPGGDSARGGQSDWLAEKALLTRLSVDAGRAALLRTSKADLPTASAHGVSILQAGGGSGAESTAGQPTIGLAQGFFWADLSGEDDPVIDSETMADYICKRCPFKHILWRHREAHICKAHVKAAPFKCSQCINSRFMSRRAARVHCSTVHKGINFLTDNSALSDHVSAVFGAYFSGQSRRLKWLKTEPVGLAVAQPVAVAQTSTGQKAAAGNEPAGLKPSSDLKRTVIEELLRNGKRTERQPQPNFNHQRGKPIDLSSLPRTRNLIVVNVATAERQANSPTQA